MILSKYCIGFIKRHSFAQNNKIFNEIRMHIYRRKHIIYPIHSIQIKDVATQIAVAKSVSFNNTAKSHKSIHAINLLSCTMWKKNNTDHLCEN